MSSILEFLKEVEELASDETIIQTPYSKTSALELRTWSHNLEKSFNEDPTGEETRTLFTKANSIALGLEWHLSIVNEKYREKRKHRSEAEILFKSMQAILSDYNMRKDQFEADEVALAEFAILMNNTYKYYRHSLNFVWNRNVYDDVLVEKIKAFMEDYNNGNYFRNHTLLRSNNVADVGSAEYSAGSDGDDTDIVSSHVAEESVV